ncbi:MAG: CerR family C-terminal domain-containing protein [Opitutales bacterium]|jgi:AcrR family transcriptional regulator
MIQAAIEVFGELGYDGASTRSLARRAGVNLASIPYHFGGKRQLYIAAAQAIAAYARKRMDPLVAHLRDADRADHASRIDEALSGFFRLIADGTEPKAWASFFIRCERDADDAFRMIHEEIVARFERAMIETVSEATGCNADDECLRMRVALALGLIVNFRTLRNMTLSSLGWDALTPERISRLDQIIRRVSLAELLSVPAESC